MNRADGDNFAWTKKLKGIKRPTLANPSNKAVFLLTHLFLDIGLQVVEEDLNRGGSVLHWTRITRKYLVKRVAQAAVERSLKLNIVSGDGAFRDRWQSAADYLRDLVAYAMHAPRWRDALSLAQDQLCSGMPDVAAGRRRFSNLINSVASKDMSVRLRCARYFIFQLGLTVDSEYRPIAREAHIEYHRKLAESWIGVYKEALDGLGLTLRPGESVERLDKLFSSLAQGLTMSATATGDESFVTDENGDSLLARGVMLMLVAAIDDGSRRGVRDILDALPA